MKQKILDTITDMIADFLYYDRRDDEDLPKGAIEKAIENGEITISEITQKFERELIKGLHR